MSHEIAIKIDGVSKRYEIGKYKDSSLRGSLANLFKSKNTSKEDFWALKNVSFEVNQGDVFGIIGKNGAGKSTMLKILSQITKPTEGKISINGRIASLLEVGTGFHPELTGRENIYLNGTILGMTRKEVKAKFDDIVAFSGIEKFIDTPVKHYSSGQYVRLAFSVAAHLEPEILVIDEVLAVGDAEFQKKCLGKMKDVARHDRTVLFVSHDMGAIASLCNKIIVLDQGQVAFQGDTNEGIEYYLTKNDALSSLNLIDRTDRGGDGKLRFSNIEFINTEGKVLSQITSGSAVNIKISFVRKVELTNVVFRLQFVDHKGNVLSTLNNYHSSAPFSQVDHDYVLCKIPKLPLFDGEYSINLLVVVNGEFADEIENAYTFTVETGNFYKTGKIPSVKSGMLMEHEWTLD